ncbi:MAG: DUF2399 domain-containing protein [Gallionella sp.]|nr:DUF2399 domain-containing protein [Gallionella sp.]MDD4959998.1 DUF2399 domain-containing protein [Gallionella sp.]
MEKALIKALLRICQSDESRFNHSEMLADFVREYNIGQPQGRAFNFTAQDKTEIASLLDKTAGIDAKTTSPTQWDGLSRVESLAFGSNEKLSSAAVRDHRVAIKSLSNRPLLLNGQHIFLPDGCNLDIDGRWVSQHCAHQTVLVVENWEVFERVHQVNFDLAAAGENPLVVFRGSPVYQQNHLVALLQALKLPVFAFVDFDPAGLVLAQSLPYFQDLLIPPREILLAALKQCTNHARYQTQLKQAASILDQSTHPTITEIWRTLQTLGTALPQEYFLRRD